MSHIHGKGYGSDHNWINSGVQIHGLGAGNKFSEFECSDCGAYFRHFYDVNPNIYDVMEKANVPIKCGKRK